MDSLTHTVIGACLGEAIAGKQLGKKAMLFGAFANNLPDVDVLANFWADETDILLIHRGITHSILVSVLLTPLLAIAFKRFYKNYDVSLNRWLFLFGSGLFLHIFIDAYTTYGTGWFEPFSDKRISFNAIFILDPLLTLPVLISTIALLILKRNSTKRAIWMKGGLIASSLYLCAITINKIYVNQIVSKSLVSQKIASQDFMATPTPLNNFLWYIIVNTGSSYRIGYYSIFDKSNNIQYEQIARNDSLLEYPCDPDQVNDLIKFSQHYYCARLEKDTIIFSDMRFGQIGGWYKANAPFVFNFKMAQNCSNKTALQEGRAKAFDTETTIQLFRRLKGRE